MSISVKLRNILLIALSLFGPNLLASATDPVSQKLVKQTERIKRLRFEIYEQFESQMKEKEKENTPELHSKAELLTATYLLTVPQMLSHDFNFIDFFYHSEKYPTIVALLYDEGFKNLSSKLRNKRREYIIEHNSTLKKSPRYAKAKKSDNLEIEYGSSKSSIDTFDEKEAVSSYATNSDLDHKFYRHIKIKGNIRQLFWQKNPDIEHIFDTVSNSEILGSITVRLVPELILQDNFHNNYKFTMDLLFESAYIIIKKDPERFIQSTYDKFYSLLEQDPNGVKITTEIESPSLEEEDEDKYEETNGDKIWDRFISRSMAIIKSQTSDTYDNEKS